MTIPTCRSRASLPAALAFAFALAGCGGAIGGPGPGSSGATASPAASASPVPGASASPNPGGSVSPGASSAPSAAPSGAPASAGPAGSTAASCLAGATPAPIAAGGSPAPGTWVAAWGATLSTATGAPTAGSVRDIIRPSTGGSALRIRLSNPDASVPLVVCAAYVARQVGSVGPQLVAGTTRQITFGGMPGITLAPKTDYVYSDPVTFAVTAQQNLAVSLFLSASTAAAAFTPTWTSSYATAAGAGDQTRDESGTPYTTNFAGTTSTAAGGFLQGGKGYAVTALDVLTTDANGAVAVFGSSTFHGYESDLDTYDDVAEDLDAAINAKLPAGLRKTIVNAGIGGDSLYLGLARLQRDVFSQTGIAGVVLYDINDLANNRTVAQVEADYVTAVAMGHAHGLRVYCPTWAPEATDITTEPTQSREQVNAYLRTSDVCDGFVDWDMVLRDPQVPQTYDPAYFSDGIHPNAAGHAAIANAVPLSAWFTGYAFPPQNGRATAGR